MGLTGWRWAAALGAAFGAIACGTNKDIEVDCQEGAGCVETPGDATVDVVKPGPEAATQAGGPTVPIEADVRGFKLKPTGACGGSSDCGHLNITVEGCKEAQVETHGERAVVDLSTCGPGEQKIVVLLHNDRHAVVLNDGKPVGAVVLVLVDADQGGKKGKGHGKKNDHSANDCNCDCD
jgi:hypothetical protein